MPIKTDLLYLSPASEDFEEIIKYHIAQSGPQSGRKIYTVMKTAIEKLTIFPLMGQIHPDPLLAAEGFRKLVLTGTYVAVYKIIDGVVVIYRIVNGRTDYPKLLK